MVIKMTKKCSKCNYGDGSDVCRVWGIPKRKIQLKQCSEKFGHEIMYWGEVTCIRPDESRKIILFERFNQLGKKIFGKEWVDSHEV
jgi:hypothetical protein